MELTGPWTIWVCTGCGNQVIEGYKFNHVKCQAAGGKEVQIEVLPLTATKEKIEELENKVTELQKFGPDEGD